MKKQGKTTLDLYNEAMGRMKELTEKNDLAIISAFYDREPDPESTEKMKRMLSKLLYGHCIVDGQFADGSHEETALIISPDGILYENFRSTVLAIADIFDRQSFILWSSKTQEGAYYVEISPGEYCREEVFTSFDIDERMEKVRTDLKKDTKQYTPTNVTEWSRIGGGCSAYYGHRLTRKNLLESMEAEIIIEG